MFNNMTYERLKEITEKEKPYRGREREEYPYVKRSHGNKYFSVGEDCFEIYYYGHLLIKIHKGNIVEFMNDHYDQGEKTLLNGFHQCGSFTQGWWYNGYQMLNMDSRGGCCMAHITDRDKKKYNIYPVRKGIKYNMLSDIPITKYDVLARKLIRKQANSIYEKHNDDFILADSIFSALGDYNSKRDYIDNIRKDTPKERGETYMEFVTRAKEKSVIDGMICSLKRYYYYDSDKDVTKIIKDYKDYLHEFYGAFEIKKHPCEDKYFPSNKYIQIQMRGE